MARKLFLLVLFAFSFQLHLHFSGGEDSMESVPDLQKSMYMDVDGYPCVRLLSLSGEIGCSNPGRDKVVAPITRFNDTKDLAQLSTVLVSLDEFESFFTRLSNDSSFARNVGGVIVESTAEARNRLKGFSPAQKFPQAEFAPYHKVNYEWNPIGSGIMWKTYNFPVFLLSETSTMALQEVAIKNKVKKAHTDEVAEFDLVMQTTKSGTRDSASCLKEETCLPLGGYSVWSSLPPMNISSSDQSKPVILTVASMDSSSFFRDKSFGADSPISGLISLLAAVDALSHVDGLDELSKQLVFLIFTGEAWGYLGSRRFMLELDLQSDAVSGLNSTLIETVMEVGSVGKSISKGAKTFYAHTTGVSSATNKTLDALKRAEESLGSDNLTVSSANSSNPGIPPSSLMTFLKKNPLTSGVVLEDFDTEFTNKFYHSHLDDSPNINLSAIVASSNLVARSLYILASDKNLSSSALSAINVNASLVKELIGCLLSCNPGLTCELVRTYISPTDTCPSHYVGVILGEPTSKPSPGYVGDVARFVWNFLADRTSTPRENGNSVCEEDCSKKGEVCIKAETKGKGTCVVSTTRYVPAYSTRLKFESGTWKLLASNTLDPMGMVDPVWTESNWNTIGLRVYTVQSAGYDRLVLLGGIAVTGLSYIAIIVTRAFIRKTMKLD